MRRVLSHGGRPVAAVHRLRFGALAAFAAAGMLTVGCDATSAPSGDARSLGPVSTPLAAAHDTLVRDLVTPWGIAPTADGRIFVTERTGCLKVLHADGRVHTLHCLDVYATDDNWHPESGLMGIALHPDFVGTQQLYLYATVRRDAAPPAPTLGFRIRRRLGLASDGPAQLAHENRIFLVQLQGDSVRDVRPVVTGIPASHYHAGGALAFGPDGMLYATVGDARLTDLAQQPDALLGKILRYRADGSIPEDNPIAGSPVWAWGFRNPQGLTWLSDGTLVTIDHGPSGLEVEGLRTGRDELNIVARGANHGWPLVAGLDTLDGGRVPQDVVAPVRVWNPAVAPAGLAYEGRDEVLGTERVVVGRLRGGLERLHLRRNGDGWRVVQSELLDLPALRRIRSVHISATNGWLVSTSNIGIRGTDLGADDLLLRIRLTQP